MKKHIYLFMAVAAVLLASCKNEDISISREVTFNVNPYTVVRDFTKYEYSPGDFSTVYWYDWGDRLRVQLFVYDGNGDLVDSNLSYLDNYNQTMRATCNLDEGSYTVVAITDEVGLNGNQVTDEYWFFSGVDRLPFLKILPNNDWRPGAFMKLGITHQHIQVGAGHTTFDIEVKAAGAMIQSWIYNVHGFTDVQEYSLWMNRKNGNFTFENDGSYRVGYEQVNYTCYLRATNPDEFTAGNIYDYNFIVPYGNTGFRWEVLLDDNLYYTLLQEEYANIQTGKSYSCILNINGSNSSFSFTEFDGGKNFPTGDAVLLKADKQQMFVPSKPETIRHLEINEMN